MISYVEIMSFSGYILVKFPQAQKFIQYIVLLIIKLLKNMLQPFEERRLTHAFGSTWTLFGNKNENSSTREQSLLDNPLTLDHCILPNLDGFTFRCKPGRLSGKGGAQTQRIGPQPPPKQNLERYQEKRGYQVLEKILVDENQNLKNQNSLLLDQIYKLKTAGKLCQDKLQQKHEELARLKKENEAQQRRGDQYMSIIRGRLNDLQMRMKEKQKKREGEELLKLLLAEEQ